MLRQREKRLKTDLSDSDKVQIEFQSQLLPDSIMQYASSDDENKEYHDDGKQTMHHSVLPQESQFSMRPTQYMAQIGNATQTEAYNPDQDQREVLEIRKTYTNLLNELERNKSELAAVESEKLSILFDEANNTFSNVKNTADASLDSRFLTASSEIGVAKVHLLPLLVSEFTFETLCKVVRDYLLDNSWDDLGKLSGSHWVGVETCDFMLGPMDLQPREKVVKTVVKRTREADGPVVMPKVLDLKSRDENEEQNMNKETSDNVMKVYGFLEGIGSFPFYHFITDPTSFAKTVENLFYVSFLIRDNRARLFIPEVSASTNELFIEAIIPEEDEMEVAAELPSEMHQIVFGMTEKMWRKNIERYNIVKPFISL